MKKINKKIIITIIVIAITLVGYKIYESVKNSGLDEILYDAENAEKEGTEEMVDENIKTNDKILVHVSGNVQKEGVYELEKGKRVSDAIESAGGLTEHADLKKINLADFLEDGEKIYIPSEEENYNISETETEKNEINTQKNLVSKININTANQGELETLPGIGKLTAAKIIEYRKENGKFKNIEDIKNVKGIGEEKYKKIENLIKI